MSLFFSECLATIFNTRPKGNRSFSDGFQGHATGHIYDCQAGFVCRAKGGGDVGVS